MHRRSRCTVHDTVRSEFDAVNYNAAVIHNVAEPEHIAEHKPINKHDNRPADTECHHVDAGSEPVNSIEHHIWHILHRHLFNRNFVDW